MSACHFVFKTCKGHWKRFQNGSRVQLLPLLIEHRTVNAVVIYTNIIVVCMRHMSQVIYTTRLWRVLHVTRRLGFVVARRKRCGHTTHPTPQNSQFTTHSYISQMTRQTSHVTRHTSHVTRHTSHVTRHTSHVTRHTSHVTRHQASTFGR